MKPERNDSCYRSKYQLTNNRICTTMISNIYKYLLLTSIILLTGCRKDNLTISELIIGKWDWVRSVSPWTGQVTNPHTAGYSIRLVFSTDGIMKEYRNDTLSNSSNYSIETNPSEPGRNFIIYNSGLQSQVDISSDTLILNASYIDGPVSSYIRLK